MSNPLKCARTEIGSEFTGPSSNLDPSTANSTWFDDGSIVLNVETTLFRVHRTTLSKHSTVFEDMFSIPQPPDQATIEGCPIVKKPDSARDFAYLLKALYDPL